MAARTPDQIIASLQVLNEDLNGPHTYTDDKAVFGYVAPGQQLVIPISVAAKCPLFLNPGAIVNLTDVETMKIVAFNFDQLVTHGYSPAKAIRMAILRARWIKLGFLLQTRNERKTPIDEVIVADNARQALCPYLDDQGAFAFNARHEVVIPADDAKAEVVAGWFVALQTVDVEKWHLQAPLLWAVAAHVFRVRGHHYKAEYEELYARTWAGTTMELPDNTLNWEDMGRTAIHSFGIAALERGAAYLAANGKLTRNLLIRRTATPCGAATIGTAYAAVVSLQGTPWWKDFYALYGPQVDSLAGEHKTMVEGGIRCHMNASLYGYDKLDLNHGVAEAMAPILQGYVKALPAGSALKGQKTLNKHADASPMMSELFKEWLTGRLDDIPKQKNLRQAIEGPQIEE